MTLAITHNFVTTKADGTDSTLLRPSNWNENHVIELASAMLVGRQTAGSGAAEEIPCSAAAATLLAAADIPAILALLGVSAATTGDGKITLKTTADAGWLLMNDGTFGNASSGASNRANADTSALFTLLYALADADAPILTSAGAATTRAAQGSAATAFAAGCRMTLPRQLGRAIVGAGAGSGLTSRALGSAFGGAATLVKANLPALVATGTIAVTNGAITVTGGANYVYGSGTGSGVGGGGAFGISGINGLGATQAASSATFTGTAMGGTSDPVDVTQASTAWNVMVKL